MTLITFYIIFFIFTNHNILHSSTDKGMDYVYFEYEVQKTQNLGIGSCIGKSENFCSEQVENSICNRLKNECFCKKGYVAIREEDRVTCKTLLTNLKCRVDSDCIHINRSTCHPGAGQCACPGNTVYSVELHACRSRFSEDQNPFCLTCQQLNGVCFKYDYGDNTSVSFKYKSDFIGCACSRNYATSITNYKKFSDLCRTTLSDIGEFCDNRQYFCQSKYAECRTINEENSSQRLCHCTSDKVPVYQSHLHYFECFPKLSKTHPNCLSCHNLYGYCYDMNNDDIGDGCICPPRLSSETSNLDFQLNLQLCKINTVHEQCSNGYFSICYQPHTEPPYEHLTHDIESNISTVNLVNRNDDKCNLQKIASYNKYCIRIDLLDFSYNCGVQMHKLKFGKLLYQAILEVRLDRNIKQPSKDLVIPVSCISDHFQREIKNQSDNLSTVIKVPDAPILNLGLQILDKFNKEVFSLVEGSEIKFDLSLIDSQGKFRGMRIEECYTSNHSTVIHEKKSNYGDKIISKGCPIFSNGFFASFKNFVSPGIHLQSDLFQVFRHGNLHSIFYKCFIKVCMDVKDCENVKCYNQELKYQPEDKQYLKNSTKSVIFKRWTHIEVQKLQGYKNTKPGTDNSVCHHVVCLSASQTVLIALLLLFLLLMVIVLLIFYSRGKALSNGQSHQILTPSYFNSTNTNSKPKQSVLSSENNSILSFRNSQTTTMQRPSKGVPYLDTYLSLTPQFSYTVDSGRDTELNSYSNNNFDLQRNAYARQISPNRATSDRKSQRTSDFVNLSEQNNPTSSLDYVEPCYISIRRSNISQPVSVHHQINPTNVTQCSCGSKECEYQPFILTPTSS